MEQFFPYVFGAAGALIAAAIWRLGSVAASHDRRLNEYARDKGELEQHVSFLAKEDYKRRDKPSSFKGQIDAAVDKAIDAIEGTPRFLKKGLERPPTIKRPSAIDENPGPFEFEKADNPSPVKSTMTADQVDERARQAHLAHAGRIQALEEHVASLVRSVSALMPLVTKAVTSGAVKGVTEEQLTTAKTGLRTELDLINNRLIALARLVAEHSRALAPTSTAAPEAASSEEPAAIYAS